MADALDGLDNPAAITLADLAGPAPSLFSAWLKDRKNSRQIPHRLEAVGYVTVRNPHANSGLWRIGGRRQAVYARHDLSLRDQIASAERLR